MRTIYYCIDCNKKLTSTRLTKRCRECYIKYCNIPENNKGYKRGEMLIKHYCNCGHEINYQNALYGSGRCRKCYHNFAKISGMRKGKKNGRYKHGKCKNRLLYLKFRRKTDINFKLTNNLRSRIYNALKGNNKSKHTMELIGCSIENLKIHLKNQFTKGMSWKNHGNGCHGRGMKEWHVDHIIPCTFFDLSKPEEQQKCFNYKNLQPLWALENIKKRKYEKIYLTSNVG
jgi:hypothetical protein